MPEKERSLFVVVGPNGSGKSSVSEGMELSLKKTKLFVNPDLIAREFGLDRSPEDMVKAANIAEQIRRNWLREGASFGFETVGTHSEKLDFIREAKSEGYLIRVLFVTTNDPEINRSRIRDRVMEGGHDVPAEKIVSRYDKVMGLLTEYIDLADTAYVADNSGTRPVVVFTKEDGVCHIIENPDTVPWVKVLLADRYADAVRDLPDPDPSVYDDRYWRTGRARPGTPTAPMPILIPLL